MAESSYRFGVLGPLLVERDGQTVCVRSERQRVLLALLLLSAGEPVSRDRLIDELWGERPPQSAVSALHVHLSKLRGVLGPLLESGVAGYVLAPAGYELDLRRFDALVEAARVDPARAPALLREALSLCRGQPLADVPAEGRLGQWRRALEEKLLLAIEARIDADLESGAAGELVPELERLISEHPFEERLRGQQMRALVRSGRQADALETYQRARTFLVQELGLEPGEPLQRLHRSILEGDPGLLGPGTSPRAKRPSNLPRPPTPLVGREQELAALTGLAADPDVRLVTLTGPGGVGKTRLLVAIADRLEQSYRDGAVFVRLDHLTEPELVPAEIATALAQRDGIDGLGADGLASQLRDRELLLLLDNFEQLLPAAVSVADLLARAPGVRVFASSRAPLRVRGEQVFDVDPLELPAGEGDAELAESAAVQLFLQRALAADRRLHIDAPLTRQAGRICRALDGLPLAIELAASQSRALSPEQIADQLGSPLGIGEGALRDLPARQQTLEATIAWSYALLTPTQREVFRAAGTFRGGFTASALEAVLGRPASAELQELVESSLIRKRGQGERFALLELVRTFAVGRLEAEGQAKSLFEQHRRHFAEAVGPASEAFDAGRAPGELAAPLLVDHANLWAALESAIDADDRECALRLALGSRPLWLAGMMRQESQELVDRLLARFAVPEQDEIKLLRAVAFVEASSTNALTWTRRVAARAAEIGDRDAVVVATCNLMGIAFNMHDRDEIERLKPSLLQLVAEDPGHRALGWLHYYLALNAYVDGEFDAACEHAAASAEAAKAAGHAFMLASAVATRLLAESARDGEIPQVALADAIDLMRGPSVEPLAVFGLWFVARYSAAVAPESAGQWLAHAERIRASLDTQLWPENVLRDETMAALGLEDLTPLLGSTPPIAHAAALERAAAWLAERDPSERAARRVSELILPPSA